MAKHSALWQHRQAGSIGYVPHVGGGEVPDRPSHADRFEGSSDARERDHLG
jgi:hypothetical protein